MLRLTHKGQSTAEYAIVIGLVIAAAVAMQIYVKRGLQAKVKLATDYNDPASTLAGGGLNILGKTPNGQFEPNEVTTDPAAAGMHSTSATQEKLTTKEGGSVTREILGADRSTNTGKQNTNTVPVP